MPKKVIYIYTEGYESQLESLKKYSINYLESLEFEEHLVLGGDFKFLAKLIIQNKNKHSPGQTTVRYTLL